MKLKNINKLNFLSQVVSLSGDFVSLEFILHRKCRFIGGIRSAWLNLSDTLTGIDDSRDSFFQTVCHHSKGFRSTWIGFTESFFIQKNCFSIVYSWFKKN